MYKSILLPNLSSHQRNDRIPDFHQSHVSSSSQSLPTNDAANYVCTVFDKGDKAPPPIIIIYNLGIIPIIRLVFVLRTVRTDSADLLLLGEGAGKAALGEVVLDSTLLSSSRLCESYGATEWAGESSVLELSNADVLGASN